MDQLIKRVETENNCLYEGYNIENAHSRKYYGEIKNISKSLSTGKNRFATSSHCVKDDVLETAIYVQKRKIGGEKQNVVVIIFESFENLSNGITSNEIFLRTTLKPVIKKYLSINKPDYFYCSNVLIFRDSRENNYAILKEPIVVSFIFVENDKASRPLIQEVFETGLRQGHNNLVLSVPKIEEFTTIFGQVMAQYNIVNRYRSVTFVNSKVEEYKKIIEAFDEENGKEKEQMFTTDVSYIAHEEDQVMCGTFNVYNKGRKFYSFLFPRLKRFELETLVKGANIFTTDNNGFCIEQKDGEVSFLFHSNDEYKTESRLFLTHQECRKSFAHLLEKKVFLSNEE